jgi:predicted kinase
LQSLTHVLWIGGAPGSGKTTVAKRIARRHGLRWYNADAHTWDHRDRALEAGDPAALHWEAMTPRERWVATSPAEMVDLSLNLERGPMIVDALRALPAAPLVVAEGSTVLPDLVASGIADRSRAVWLAPTRDLQRARLEERGAEPEGDADARRARARTSSSSGYSSVRRSSAGPTRRA